MSSFVTSLRHAHRRLVAGVVLALLALVAGPALVAQAANYQFWGYWQLTSGSWAFAQNGPDQTVPADGSVEGWRFAVDDGSGTRKPRVTPTFDQVCAATPAESGKKRVAVVIDAGREADGDGTAKPPAPVVGCAKVATTATGSQVLAAVSTVRVDKGMVCGINGYPAAGCGGEVATLSEAQKAADTPIAFATPTPSATNAAAGSSSGFPVTAVVVVGLAALIVLVVARMRSRSTTEA
ncbi:MAG: hypothetical protein IPM08_08785 [Actinomycetales bacterium]|nr:hypothetical protein [Actinomycetales bacterium]